MNLRTIIIAIVGLVLLAPAWGRAAAKPVLSQADLDAVIGCAWNNQHDMLDESYRPGTVVTIKYSINDEIRTEPFWRLYLAVYKPNRRTGQVLVFGMPKSRPHQFTLANNADFKMAKSRWLLTSDPFGGLGSERRILMHLALMRSATEMTSFKLSKLRSPPESCENILFPPPVQP